MKRIALASAALALAALATPARAESPRWGSFELQVGQFRPDVDGEFADRPTPAAPWSADFGGGRGWMFELGAAKALLTGFGTLEAGLQAGYFQQTGHGRGVTSGTVSGDETKFQMIPTSATLTYRFDFLADRYGIPFAPYGRLAFERYNWWISDGAGKTSMKGATNGWSAAAGLALLLDFFDPGLARELDADAGVNNTYLFGEVRRSSVDDFGSSRSWDLSDDGIAWTAGLLFVF